MSRPLSTRSIPGQDASSDGVSPRSSTSPWNPSRCDASVATPTINLGLWNLPVSEPALQEPEIRWIGWPGIRTAGTVGSHPSIEASWQRNVCHYLVERLPEEALAELREAIKDILEFHSWRPTQPPFERPAREVPATLGESSVRPKFQIETE